MYGIEARCTRLEAFGWESSTSDEERNSSELDERDLGKQHSL
jgi:hypothetical protein